MVNLRMIKNVKGTIFIVTMIFSMLMIFIAVAASNMLLQDTHMINHLRYATQAQRVAEAGINDALATLISAGVGPSGIATGQYLTGDLGAGMTYTVTVSSAGEAPNTRYLFSSEGVVARGGRTFASNTAAVELADFQSTALNYGIAAGTDLQMAALISLININGNIHGNNQAMLLAAVANLNVVGTATATNDYVYAIIYRFFLQWTITIDGTAYTNPNLFSTRTYILGDDSPSEDHFIAPLVTFPQFDYANLRELAMDSTDDSTSDPCYHGGDEVFSGETLRPGSGIIYVKGTATFNGTCHLYGGIVAERIYVNGSLYQHVSGDSRDVIIARTGNIEIRGRLDTENALVFAGRDFISREVLAAVDVEGGILARRNVRIWDFITYLNYTHEAVPLADILPFRIVSWNR